MTTRLWSDKGYGKWLALPPGKDSEGRAVERCLIILAPGADTGMSVSPDKLDRNGLRAHPDTVQEKMTVIGYAVPRSERPKIASIVRRFNTGGVENDGLVLEDQPLSPGKSMLTVESNGAGSFHVIINRSPVPQVVRFEKLALRGEQSAVSGITLGARQT